MKDRSPLLCLLSTVLLALLASIVPGYGEATAERFIVRSWQSEDGLPSNIVRAVTQAADGYLWIATAEGLVRFDGVRFSTFPNDEDAAAAARPPRALFAHPGGDVWVTTSRGGLLRWNGQRLVTVWEDAVAGQPANLIRQVTQVVSDGETGVYIERGEELFHFAGTGTPRMLERTPELTEKLRVAVSIQWKHGATTPPGAPLELLGSHGRLWMRTLAGGLAVSEAAGESEVVVLPELTPGTRITALFEDRENNLWVATSGSGLFQIRSPRVRMFDTSHGLSDRTVQALLEDRSGAMWVANKSGSVDRIIEGQVTRFEVGGGDVSRGVGSLCEDRSGTIWAARRGGSLFRWTGAGFRPISGTAMPVWKVTAMVVDAEGTLWLGDETGLAAWADGALTRYGAAQGMTVQDISTLALDGLGGLWVGTARGLLFHGRDGRFKKVGELGNRSVSSLLPDADGAVWATTLGSGLFSWKKGNLTRFSAREGLLDDRLTCVLDDGAGYLWLGSLGGIFRVAKTELADIAAHRRAMAYWVRFDRTDGMLSRECTGDFQPAGWRSHDGTLSFPTLNGIAKVQPATLELETVPPPVVIESAGARGRTWDYGSPELRVGPGRARLEFRYTAPVLGAPEKVRFRTMLEGLDQEWRDAGTQRTVAYEAVPPGSYHFRVLAANGDGVWNETGAALPIVVVPHFWETPSFRIVAIVCAIALALGIGMVISRARLRGRLLRLQVQTSRHKERTRIAQDLHDDLGASLTEISILSHLAAEDPERVHPRDRLAEIATKARRLVGALDEIVWAANPRHDTVASLADYLAAYAAEFLDAASIALRLDIPIALPSLPLEPEQRHGLFLAVREALNNAVKHSGASEVRLRLSVDGGELQVAVEDNGHGLTVGPSDRSEGLRNMPARMADLGGGCHVESGAAGTSVCFSLPLVRS